MLACPGCHAPLTGLECACGLRFQERDGVADLFLAAGDEATTRTVGAFYEESPFPEWRDEDDRGTLLRKGRDNPFTRWLDEVVPPRAAVVELGCGTGQLPLFMGLAGRPVLGVDLSAASLGRAEAFRQRIGLSNVRFVRGNLFRPPVAPGSADLAVSTGVLHHTADPQGGFRQLASLVRPGGLVVVGLYNTLGRLLLPMLRSRHAADASRRGKAWFRDQHEHPHESTHSVGEVLGWLDEAGIEFVRAFPEISLGGGRGAAWEHALVQLGWLGRAADGGLWVTVGQKM